MNIQRFKTPDTHRMPDIARSSLHAPNARIRRRPTGSVEASITAKPSSLRLGHVHIHVRDLARSEAFYVQVLGLRLSERVARFAFLTTGEEHHAIALEEIGEWAISPPRRATGIAHVAFEVPDQAAFNAMKNLLSEKKIPFISGDNGTNWSLYVKDPDGHQIQILLDRRDAPGGTPLWRGRWYGPLKSD